MNLYCDATKKWKKVETTFAFRIEKLAKRFGKDYREQYKESLIKHSWLLSDAEVSNSFTQLILEMWITLILRNI